MCCPEQAKGLPAVQPAFAFDTKTKLSNLSVICESVELHFRGRWLITRNYPTPATNRGNAETTKTISPTCGRNASQHHTCMVCTFHQRLGEKLTTIRKEYLTSATGGIATYNAFAMDF